MKYKVIKEIELAEFDTQLEALQVMASLQAMNSDEKNRYSVRSA